MRKGSNGEDGYSGFTMRDPVMAEDDAHRAGRLLRDRGVQRVVVCGLATDYCVGATALDARSLGLATTVLLALVRAVDLAPGDGERMLSRLSEAGVRLEAQAPE